MKALNEKHVYDLTELTSEEKNYLLMYLTKVNESWAGDIEKIQFFECDYLYFCFDWVEKGEWLVSRDLEFIKNKQVTNAKELFYTLENVQVDVLNSKQEEIKSIIDIYILNKIPYVRRTKKYSYSYIMCNDSSVNEYPTITYEKFMELFGYKEKSEEFKNLVEVLNEELTEEAYKETEYEVTMIAEQPKDQIPNVGKMVAYKEIYNKLNYELDFNFITQLAERMNANKGKYEPYNWQKLDNIEDLKQALYRHVMEVMKGNYEDDNRLFGHLEAIALNSMFINYQLNK